MYTSAHNQVRQLHRHDQGIIAVVRDKAENFLHEVGGPESIRKEFDQLLKVHQSRAATGTGRLEASAVSKYSIIAYQQILQYWYFDGVPLSVRILFYFGVLEGLFRVSEEQRPRWVEFASYMDELRSKERTLGASQAVGGWLFPGESEVLWDMARRAASLKGQYCELGAWLGKSSLIWCNALREFAPTKKLLVVDNWNWGKEGAKYPFMIEGRDIFLEFKSNLAGLEEWYRPYKSLIEDAHAEVSSDLGGEGLALLFHDASHSYDEVKRDLHQYVPLLNKGGYLIVHDYNHRDFPEVRAAVESLRSEVEYLEAEGVISTLGIFRRKNGDG